MLAQSMHYESLGHRLVPIRKALETGGLYASRPSDGVEKRSPAGSRRGFRLVSSCHWSIIIGVGAESFCGVQTALVELMTAQLATPLLPAFTRNVPVLGAVVSQL